MQEAALSGVIPGRISDFVRSNKVTSVCCVDESADPYCFSCFYAFDNEHQLLFFKSSATTKHSILLTKNNRVSGTILPDKIELLTLKGIQFTGRILYDSFPAQIHPWDIYHRTFPFALAKRGNVWCVQIDMLKMVDNTALGAKLRWER